MKTLKLSSLCLSIMLLSGVYTVYAGQPVNRNNSNPFPPVIRHQVNVYPVRELTSYQTYIVQVVDENGTLVAPSQTYIPGLNAYTFYERGPRTGTRIARLAMIPQSKGLSCIPYIYCAPDIKSGTFLNGRTYTYNLYPKMRLPE